MATRLPTLVQFLQRLGFEIVEDFDGQWTFHCPAQLTMSPGEIGRAMMPYAQQIIDEIRGRMAWDRRQFVGGPFNGSKYGCCGWQGRMVLRVARARWAVYVVKDRYNRIDQRAFFVGEATSESKGRKLAWQYQVKIGQIEMLAE